MKSATQQPQQSLVKSQLPLKRKAKATGKAAERKLPFKGRHVYTVEEIAQRDCPFPPEPGCAEEWEKFHAEKRK